MCGSMIDIQTSNLRPLRLGEEKKEERKKKPQDEKIYIWPALLHGAAINYIGLQSLRTKVGRYYNM